MENSLTNSSTGQNTRCARIFPVSKALGIQVLEFQAKLTLPRVAHCATIWGMIKSFKHKGLKQFFETGKKVGIQAKHVKKLRMQLAAIDTAQILDDIDLPGFFLHPLKGNRSGIWSISVSGNWRVTFEFRDGNAYVLNYEDYH